MTHAFPAGPRAGGASVSPFGEARSARRFPGEEETR